MYKILSKDLFQQPRDMLDATISTKQSVFMGGRQFLDVTLVANEVVDDVKWRKHMALNLSSLLERP